MKRWRCKECKEDFWVEILQENCSVAYCPFCGTDSGVVVFVDVE